MTRQRFVLDGGQLVPWATVARERREHAEKSRSALAAPMVIRDGLDGILNHADGKRYDSKSAYYRAVRAAGCEIVGDDPVATEPSAPARPAVTQAEVGEAMRKVEAGYKPATETSELAAAIETGLLP